MFDLDFACGAVGVCQDDDCDLDELHPPHPVISPCYRPKPVRSRRANQPWKIPCTEALRDATLRAVSAYEPRNFATILSAVENDYGSCCSRSVHRHLKRLSLSGDIVRMDFGPQMRIYAYLKASSRLIREPGVVLDHILSLYDLSVYE